MGTPGEKYERLTTLLGELDGALVAFSGGVDSSLLLVAAREALGDRVLAVTGRSPSVPSAELEAAEEFARRIGANHRFVDTEEFSHEAFRSNSRDRCYHCKKTLFASLIEVARLEGLAAVVEGTNLDDGNDFRPGVRAREELGVRAPLAEAGLTKEEIRGILREKGHAEWSKPALACLASRIPYGEPITEARLRRVDRAERALRGLGFAQVRVRDHGDVARIEVALSEIGKLLEAGPRRAALASVKEAGYRYVALDLEGYRTGSMNEVLESKP
jgi:uncharacterized protein